MLLQIDSMRVLYSLIWWLILPLVLFRLYWRGRKEPGYREHIPERLGFFPAIHPACRRIWVHAVSVGETRAAEPLIKTLMTRYPDCEILLTHMTPTGRETGHELFRNEKKSGRLVQAYLPYDTNTMMRRFIRHYRPCLCILLETEIWPNLIRQCKKHHVKLALVNARLSERSLKKGKKIQSIMNDAARGFSAVAAQTKTDADRLGQFGAHHIAVTGSVKFDIEPPENALEKGMRLRKLIGSRPVLMCASTRNGEEERILDVLEHLTPNALLLLVPRHPQRFDEVAKMVENRRIPVIRRSTLHDFTTKSLSQNTRILLGDSMGEMFMYYTACDIAFIGGSLEKLGGQNLIEACAVGKPVLVGPHTFNFEAITKDAIAARAALRITSAQELMQRSNELLSDKTLLQTMSGNARMFAERQHGATERTLKLLAPLIEKTADKQNPSG